MYQKKRDRFVCGPYRFLSSVRFTLILKQLTLLNSVQFLLLPSILFTSIISHSYVLITLKLCLTIFKNTHFNQLDSQFSQTKLNRSDLVT